MLDAREVAKWFINKNPNLANGHFDENVIVNKLVYLSALMYYSVSKKHLINDSFIAFPNGPVVYKIYKDYRYNGLDHYQNDVFLGLKEQEQKVLDITNFVFADKSAKELIEMTHKHNLWKDVEKFIPNNPTIDFEDASEELISEFANLYHIYENYDFSKIKKEKINGNVFYYDPDNLELTDDVISELVNYGSFSEPQFIEMIDGELVFS